MSIILTETFESRVAGPLAGQGPWILVPGSGANPVPTVNTAGLIDGPNSGTWSTGGADSTPNGVVAVLPTPLLSAKKYRIRLRAKIDVLAVTPGTEPYIGFFNGAPDLVGFTTDAFDIGFEYDPGLMTSVFTIYDGDNPKGVGNNTGLPAGTKFSVDFDLLGGGQYRLRLNDGIWGAVRNMYPGNFDVSQFGFMSNGHVEPGVVAVDSFRFDDFDEPLTEANQREQDLYFLRQTKQELAF